MQTITVFRVDAARLAHVERPQAAEIVELAAPRARRAAPMAAKPAPRKSHGQWGTAGSGHPWEEF